MPQEGIIFARSEEPKKSRQQIKESLRRSVPVEISTSIALVSCDGLGGYDWSDQAEEGPNYALMAFLSLSPDSEVSNDSICSKSCLKTIESLKSQNDQLLKDLKKSELMVLVPPPYIGNFMPPTPDLSFTSLDEFVNEPVVENCKAMSSEEEPKVVRKNDDALIIEEWVSDDEEEDVSQPKTEKKTVRPSIVKKEFVKSKQQEKTARKTVKQVEQHRQNTHSTQSNGFAGTKASEKRSALLYGKIEEEVYICQPLGFEDPNFPDRVYKVEKALYGLHQAPKAWYETLSTYLLDNRFQRGKIDKTLFIKRHKVKTANTPIETQKLLLKDEDGEEVDVHIYRSMIRSLMYLTSSRHDIMFTVCDYARYQVNLKVSHLHAVKRIFRYLKGQPKLGLWYSKDSPFDLVAYTDSHYAGASLDRKSTIIGKEKKSVKLMMEKLFRMELELMLSTVKVKTINGEAQLHALVDGKKIIITEASVRRDLQLADEEGVECLPNSTIFEQLALMGYEKCLSPKTTAWNEFSSTMASAIISSEAKAEQDSDNINKTRSKATPNESSSLGTTSGSGLRCRETMGDTIAQTRFESVFKHFNDSLLARGNTLQSDEDRLKLDELMALCTTLQNRVLDLEKTKITQHNEIASLKKRVKKLENKNEEMFDVNVLDGEEVFVVEQEVANEKDDDGEITLAQALIEMKSTKPKDKGKGILIEPVEPMKKKDLIRLDEETTLKLQAGFDEEERLAREKAKKEKEANIALIETWDDIHSNIDIDHQLAERLQAQEQEELSIEEKATLFQQLLEKKRKHFAAKTAEEKRKKPPTKAQLKKIMCTYLKNMEVYKLSDLKLKDFDSIQEMFDRAFKRVNTFKDFRTELVEGKEKRARIELIQENTKKQKEEDDKETKELKHLMKIIPDEEEVTIDAIPLAVKSPSIVD
ncbi:uncharacterized mitochondrial protein-like protein [Tanacetum coccineum]